MIVTVQSTERKFHHSMFDVNLRVRCGKGKFLREGTVRCDFLAKILSKDRRISVIVQEYKNVCANYLYLM